MLTKELYNILYKSKIKSYKIIMFINIMYNLILLYDNSYISSYIKNNIFSTYTFTWTLDLITINKLLYFNYYIINNKIYKIILNNFFKNNNKNILDYYILKTSMIIKTYNLSFYYIPISKSLLLLKMKNLLMFYKNISDFNFFLKKILLYNYTPVINLTDNFYKFKQYNITLFNYIINSIILNKIKCIIIYKNNNFFINEIKKFIPYLKLNIKNENTFLYNYIKMYSIKISLYNNIYIPTINFSKYITNINNYNISYITSFLNYIIKYFNNNKNIILYTPLSYFKKNKKISFTPLSLIIGQNHITKSLENILKYKINSENKFSNKPLLSSIFWGPSGTGKTETSIILQKSIYKNSDIIKLDMSEFMEKHSVSRLIGSPPGYIGHEDGGQLTSGVINNPFRLILFDEIEKAHKEVSNILLQVLDYGILTDSKGKKAFFKESIIILTSNLGWPIDSNYYTSFKKNKVINKNEYKSLKNLIVTNLNKFFKPEFINRLDKIYIFKPLSIKNICLILNKFLSIFILKLNLHLHIFLDIKLKILLSRIAYNPIMGARPIKNILSTIIESPVTMILHINIIKFITIYFWYITNNIIYKINYSYS